MKYTINLINDWEKLNYENLRVNIDFDDYLDWIEDDMVKINIFDFHRNYNFRQDLNKNFMYLFDDFSNYTRQDKKNSSDWYYYKNEKQELAEIRKEYHVFFLEFYEHSSIRFDVIENISKPICQYRSLDWTSKVGFVAVSKELTKNRKKALEIAINEIERYNNYLNWEVYQYYIEEKEVYFSKDLKKSLVNFEYYDGVWGFYEYDDAKNDAIDTIKYYLNSKWIEYDSIELVED